MAAAAADLSQPAPVCTGLAQDSPERRECDQELAARSAAYDALMARLKNPSERVIRACVDAEEVSACVAANGAKVLPKELASWERELFLADTTIRVWRASSEKAERKVASIKAGCKRAGVSEGAVRIGMTREMVRHCGWGDPEDINKTTTAYGTSEQWVYGEGQYLYFTNGKLTAIQN